jgi:hypothetical protein
VRTLLSVALLLALCGCQWGPAPRIPYVDGTTYVEPGGRRTPIPGQREVGVSAVLPYAEGLLVADTRWFEGSVGLAYVHGRQRTPLGPCSTGGGVPSADHTRVAWLTTGCPEATLVARTVVHVADTDGTGGWARELDQHSLQFVAGFVGDAVVVAGWRDPVRLVPERGPVTVLPHLRHAVDTHGSLVAGRQSVLDSATGRLLWSTPRTHVTSFSPDGRLVLGYQHGALVLLDSRTGAPRATLPHGLDRVTWESPRHLLAVASGREREVLLRVDLDGSAELLGPARPVPSGLPYRYVFETGP